MKERLKHWQQKIDALNQRERVLVLLTAVVVVVMVLQLVLIDPLNAERNVTGKQIAQLSRQIQQQQAQQQIISAQLEAGIHREKINQRDQLQHEVERLNQQIEQSVVAMIPPRLMPEVLESILSKTEGLTLLSLENKPVVAVIEQDASTAPPQASSNQQALYNHGFILRLSGNYMAAIRYFETLAELPWRFYWDDMRYQVDSYPNATITLEVHTVSMSQEWIGV